MSKLTPLELPIVLHLWVIYLVYHGAVKLISYYIKLYNNQVNVKKIQGHKINNLGSVGNLNEKNI